MKVVLWSLLIASALSIIWAIFVVSLLPLGVCDSIYDPIRSEFQRPHTAEEAGHFAGRMCGQLGSMIRGSFLLICAPALATNLVWFVLGMSGLIRVGCPRKTTLSRSDLDA